MKQLEIIFPGEYIQLYLFGQKVTPEERQRAIEEALEEAEELKKHDDFLESDS